MNIFTHLGFSPNHREPSKVTQAVKHYAEVSDQHKNKHFVGQIKKDGVSCIGIAIKGEVALFSRTGKPLKNTEVVVANIKYVGHLDGVFLGELCCPSLSLEQLSGMVNPNRTTELTVQQEIARNQLEIHWFDYLTIGEFIEGASFAPFDERYLTLRKSSNLRGDFSRNVKILYTMEIYHVGTFANNMISEGHEGAIIRDPNAGWEAGHKGWRVMKIVREKTVELRCVGWEEGEGKYKGKVANLLFDWKNGEVIKCMLGKGWTHLDAELMYQAILDNHPTESPIGKIFEVYALNESSKGKLRLPKVGELRHDKDTSDIS